MSQHDTHHRRSIRLRHYSYANPGAYFATVCTHNRACLLGNIADAKLRFSPVGEITQQCWTEIPAHFPGVRLDAYVIMPNHLHGILVVTRDLGRGTPWRALTTRVAGMAWHAPTSGGFGKPVAGSLATIINLFKGSVTKRVREAHLMQDGAAAPLVWQRNYYEHVIRNDRSLNLIREYICQNPARWPFDSENPQRAETAPVNEIESVFDLDWE